jgi:hypothetical protein
MKICLQVCYMYCLFVILCIVCVQMCTVLLPPGVNPTAVNKYINILMKSEMFQTKVVEKITIHIMCSITFFPENCTLYETM